MGCCACCNRSQEKIIQVKFQKEVDIEYQNKWYSGILRETVNGKYRHQFSIPSLFVNHTWKNIDERYNDSHLLQDTFYLYSNDINDYGGLPQMIQFTTLYTHTAHQNDQQRDQQFECPFTVQKDVQLLFYYSDIRYNGYLIILNARCIHEYDIVQKQWGRTLQIAPYINDVSTFCPYVDNINHKLFLLGSGQSVFCIFDLEHFKWNFVKHNESSTRKGIGLNIENYYKRHDIKLLFTSTDSKDDSFIFDDELDDYNPNDGIKWTDEHGVSKRAIVVKEHLDKGNVSICTSTAILDQMDAVLYNKTKYDDHDFLVDEHLKLLLKRTMFHIGTNKPNQFNARHVERDTNVVSFHRKLGYVKGVQKNNLERCRLRDMREEKLEMLYVKDLKRIYVFDQEETGYRGRMIRVCYVELDDKCMRRALRSAVDTIACYWIDCIVLIQSRFILLLRWGSLESYCVDLEHGNTFTLNKKFHGFTNVIATIYEEIHHNIYFISSDGYHKIVNMMGIIPLEYFAMQIVTAFIRVDIETVGCVVPYALYDIIVNYFPVDC
eukprot:212734_1